MPIVSIDQLGIVRAVTLNGDRCTVGFAPTFIGCPATRRISGDIGAAVRSLGLDPDVQASLAEPWDVDRISDSGRKALEGAFIGIRRREARVDSEKPGLQALERQRVPCPHCQSEETALLSAFGATRCRAVRRCERCRNVFEQIKSI